MTKIFLFIGALLVTFLMVSCSKKQAPARTVSVPSENNPVKPDSAVVVKKVYKPRPKDIIPNVIVVNDKAARKSVDGRLYYDLLGHRYWKNYKNGKYYLFNQSMYSNDAFKVPK